VKIGTKKPRPESAGELYQLSGRRLSAKLVPTYVVSWCRVVSVTNPYGRNLGFVDREMRSIWLKRQYTKVCVLGNFYIRNLNWHIIIIIIIIVIAIIAYYKGSVC
jgi:hypothetical protein